MNFKNILIADKKTIKDAMKQITKSKIKTLFVVDNNKRLLGSLTDGDIRRYLSDNNNLQNKINRAANKNPNFIYESNLRIANKKNLINKKLEVIPVLDDLNRIIDVIKPSQFNLITDYVKNNYNVFIFAGGKGKRLLPLTLKTPKPMIKINKVPILESNIMRLKSLGFRKYYISVNYISHKIKNYFSDGNDFGVKIKYIEEIKELGTAGALSLLSLDKENIKYPLLVLNGDILTKLNFKRLINFHKKNSADLTIATREFSSQIPYGVLHSKNNQLISIKEKPINSFQVNAGIYVINPKILELLRFDKKIDMPEFINNILRKKKKIMCYTVNDYWKDIGSPRDLDIAKSEYASIFMNNEK